MQTRARLIRAAFDTIHAHGYQGMRVNDVLRQSGLEKGALYHHFASKIELGYAVLDQVIKPMIAHRWLTPLSAYDDPILGITETLEAVRNSLNPEELKRGCPLNNLAQEMSPLDEGFRRRIAAVFDVWIDGFAKALAHGKSRRFVRQDIDPLAAARFLVAAIEGCAGLLKAQHAEPTLASCSSQLLAYLESLRAVKSSPVG